MRVIYSERFKKSYRDAGERVCMAFDKELGYLLIDLKYPSLHTKKYDEARGIWQARVNRNWRFYFLIEDDTYFLIDIISHPK